MDEPQKTGEVKPEAAATPAGDAPKSAEAAPAAAPTSTPPAQTAPSGQPAQGGATPPPSQPKKGLPKALLFGLIGLVVVGLIAFAIFVIMPFSGGTSGEEETVTDSSVVETLTADQLGLSIEAKPDGKAVKFKIDKAGDIKTIEYQVTYEADSTAQEKAEGGEDRVQRGITGEADIEGDALKYESEWLDLGSCSRNVCKYDTGVDSVDLTLKIIKKNGKTYESEASHQLSASE